MECNAPKAPSCPLLGINAFLPEILTKDPSIRDDLGIWWKIQRGNDTLKLGVIEQRLFCRDHFPHVGRNVLPSWDGLDRKHFNCPILSQKCLAY